jgi:hypothetical protein
VNFRAAAITLILGFPAVIGAFFCAYQLSTSGDPRFLSSLLAELVALALLATCIYRSLQWLRKRQTTYPTGMYEKLVHVTSAMYLILTVVTLMNADTSGILSKGGRLDFYFSNDWFRRLVTLSTLPSAIATYHSISILISPAYNRNRLPAILNLLLLLTWSMLSGSKGAALLLIAGVIPFIFPIIRVRLAKYAAALVILGAAYIATFLLFTEDPYTALLGMLQRFYLSIDMSILLENRGVAALISNELADVWAEVFRSVNNLGVRLSVSPIGSLVYERVFGVAPTTGANCRYASLLLLYPDRLDFLFGFPVLVVIYAAGLRYLLVAVGLSWSAWIAVPFFVANSFQDVYWFATHLIPLTILIAALAIARISHRASVSRIADSDEGRNSDVSRRSI